MKRIFEIALGIVTSIGGFLDVGAIATAAEAGSYFGYQLLWAILLGTVCVIFLIEMSGRLAAVSGHALPEAVRERLGFHFFLFPLVAGLVIDFLILSSEIGGLCIALQLVTGVAFHWWAVPAALLVWVVLWLGTFGVIEKGVALLGLITLAFVVASAMLKPPAGPLAWGMLPSLPRQEKVHYWFLAVSIVGAIISPYMFNFYSSGGVEEKWDQSHVTSNRIVAVLGMGFGCVVAMAVLVTAAAVLFPRGIRVDRYEQVALVLSGPMGKAGFFLFAAGLFVACFGAALEVALDSAYTMAQGFGWTWGESLRPWQAARFSLVYTLFLIPSAALILLGVDPLALTIFSMAVTTLILPVVVFPFLVLMNDPRYLKDHTNGRIGNIAVFLIIALAFLLAVVAIPLEVWGG